MPTEPMAMIGSVRRATGSAHLLALLDKARAGIVTVDRGQAIHVANRRLGELLRIPAAAVADAVWLADLLDGSTVLTEALAHEVDAALRGSIADSRPRTIAIVIGHGNEARFLALHVTPLADATWALTFEDTTERHAAEAMAVDSALRDPLTGLLNRRLFQVQAVAALEARQARIVTARVGGPPDHGSQAVMAVDLDRFKGVNDTLGHSVGDGLLCLVAKRLRSVLRQHDALARLGGDEFALLVSPAPDRAVLDQLARRVTDVIGRPYLVDGHLVNIGASIGIAVFPEDGGTEAELLRNADLALYDAKNMGRSTHSFFRPEMDARAVARRLIEIDLRKALALRQFELHYQPQVDLDRHAIVGFEALLRWRHPERGMVSPADFIPLAEEIGLIVPLGEWVLNRGLPGGDPLAGSGHHRGQRLALPVRGRRRLVERGEPGARPSGLPGRRLEIEITEGALLRNAGRCWRR